MELFKSRNYIISILMADDNTINTAVNQLVDQLQNNTMNLKKKEDSELPLDQENLEKFLLQYSGKLIKGSVEFVDDLKAYVQSAPSPEDITAMASLVSSSAAAIETLNKILIANKNNATKVNIKTMDIESKKQLQQIDVDGKLLMNREVLLKQLIDNSKVIDLPINL